LAGRIGYNALAIYRCGTAEWQAVGREHYRELRTYG
jgi:hypothetical protein